ncbi:MAG: triose-phosphate isomerase [Planctomycetota bacterium]
MNASRIPLVAGNWKMHGSRAEARAWARAAAGNAARASCDVAVFPPAPWLVDVVEAAGPKVLVGAQACDARASGAFTGAVSAAMVADTGATLVLCGHSERRHVFGESDEHVAASAERAWEAGLTPVLCVGETLAERRAGRTREVVLRQLLAVLGRVPGPSAPLILAYEPVWAIGTGQAATPLEAAEAHGWLRAAVAERDADRAAALRILYGGSVKPDNMGGFLAVDDVDGALVGGASLDPESFARLLLLA